MFGLVSVEKENPYFFLEDFELKGSNNGVRNGLHGAFGKETVEREDEQSQKIRGKLKKILKTALTVQNMRFSRLR